MPVPHDYYGHRSHEPHLHNRHNHAPYVEPDWQANLAKDQLPDLSTIGRGPKGDGLYIAPGDIHQDGTKMSFDIRSDTTNEVIATIGPFPTGNIKVYGDPVHEPVAGENWRFYVDYNTFEDGEIKTKTEEIHVPCGAMGSLIYLYSDIKDRTPDDTYQVDEDDLTIYNRKRYPQKPGVRVNDIVILETHKKYPSTKTHKSYHKYWLTFGTVEAVEKGKVIFTARTFLDYQAVKIYYDTIIDPPFEHPEDDDPENRTWTATGNLAIWENIIDKPEWHPVAYSGEYADLENQPFEKVDEEWVTKEPINVSIFENDATYQTKAEVDEAIAKEIGKVYRYRGVVEHFADLPENPENGWVYQVNEKVGEVPAGTNWAYNEDEERWDELGGGIDWEGIATEEYVDAADERVLQEAKEYTDEAVAELSMDYNDLENIPLIYVPSSPVVKAEWENPTPEDLTVPVDWSAANTYMEEAGLTSVPMRLTYKEWDDEETAYITKETVIDYDGTAPTEPEYIIAYVVTEDTEPYYTTRDDVDAYQMWDKLDHPEFAEVAFSGDYNDLDNKPDLTVNWEDIEDKPEFADVATSGSYNDLADKPDIPDVPTILVAESDEVTTAVDEVLAERGVSR